MPKNTNQASPLFSVLDVKYNKENKPIFSCSQKSYLHNVAEIDKEEVCHLVAEEVT